MHVKLATLKALSEPQAGEMAVTWWALSRACHQHAYEIAPNHGEVAALVSAVGDQLTIREDGEGSP